MAGHTTFRGKLVPRKLWSKFVNKVDIDHKIELSWPLIYRGRLWDQAFSEKYKGLDTLNNVFTNVATNDEILTLLKLYVLLYADDTIIMAEGPSELQLALNALSEYCQTYKLKINIDKTK